MVKVLAPLSTQQSPSRTALVRVPAASEPASGSVSDQQPIHSPEASLGMYFRFCSSLPGFINVVGAERSVRGDDDADRAIHARKLFDDDGVLDVAEPRAAQFFGKDGAHVAELAELA